MAVLQGWPGYLRRKYPADHVLILDQGPIYLTAELTHFDPAELKSAAQDAWWKEIFQRWSRVLDLIVWFDASDETLRERIQNRKKQHVIRDRPGPEIRAFLKQHRTQLEHAISLFMGTEGGPRLLKIDTGELSVPGISNRLMAEFQR